MDTYFVKINPPKLKFKHRAISALRGAGLYFVIVFCWKYFWPTDAEKRGGLTGILVEALVMALVWGIAMSFLTPGYRPPKYTIIVDDELITARYEHPRLLKWLGLRNTVRKGKIRTIREFKGKLGWPDGLQLSERSGLGARLMGRVFLPSTLPDYEYLKRLAESWRVQASKP